MAADTPDKPSTPQKIPLDSEEPIQFSFTPKELVIVANCVNAVVAVVGIGAAIKSGNTTQLDRAVKICEATQRQAQDYGPERFLAFIKRIWTAVETVDVIHEREIAHWPKPPKETT